MKRNKNILVTGACGFIGSYLVKRLVAEGHQVKVFDLVNSFPHSIENHLSLKDISDRVGFVTGNIEDAESIKKEIKDQDHVFHLAGRSFVPDSWKHPAEFYRINIIGTANVLEACRIHDCSLTYISSYVYGEPDYIPIDEEHVLKSYNPYSHSKILAEQICKLYHEQYGLNISIFRPFNIFGPGQNDKFIIPEIIKQVLTADNKMIEVNNLVPRRDYLYIDDFIEALILSAGKKNQVYNIGSGYSVSVEDIIKTVLKKSGIEKKYSSRNIRRENEIDDVVADISKIRKELNWNVKTSFEEGIGKCIRYYEHIFKTEA